MIHTTETRHIPVWDMVIYTTRADGEPREINLRVCSWEANHLGHLLVQEVIVRQLHAGERHVADVLDRNLNRVVEVRRVARRRIGR